LLGPALDALMDDAARLETMSLAARQLGRPDAAVAVARDLLELTGISPNRGGDRTAPATS